MRGSVVHQDARYEENRELCIGVELFVQQVARYKGIGESRIGVESFVHQDARYEEIVNRVPRLNHSCNKLHATHEIVNYTSTLIIRASRCTLRMKS